MDHTPVILLVLSLLATVATVHAQDHFLTAPDMNVGAPPIPRRNPDERRGQIAVGIGALVTVVGLMVTSAVAMVEPYGFFDSRGPLALDATCIAVTVGGIATMLIGLVVWLIAAANGPPQLAMLSEPGELRMPFGG